MNDFLRDIRRDLRDVRGVAREVTGVVRDGSRAAASVTNARGQYRTEDNNYDRREAQSEYQLNQARGRLDRQRDDRDDRGSRDDRDSRGGRDDRDSRGGRQNEASVGRGIISEFADIVVAQGRGDLNTQVREFNQLVTELAQEQGGRIHFERPVTLSVDGRNVRIPSGSWSPEALTQQLAGQMVDRRGADALTQVVVNDLHALQGRAPTQPTPQQTPSAGDQGRDASGTAPDPRTGQTPPPTTGQTPPPSTGTGPTPAELDDAARSQTPPSPTTGQTPPPTTTPGSDTTPSPSTAAGITLPDASGNAARNYGAGAGMPAISDNQVRAFQEAILAAGGSLEPYGADGKWGEVTQTAFLNICSAANIDPSTVDFNNLSDPETQQLLTHMARPRSPAASQGQGAGAPAPEGQTSQTDTAPDAGTSTVDTQGNRVPAPADGPALDAANWPANVSETRVILSELPFESGVTINEAGNRLVENGRELAAVGSATVLIGQEVVLQEAGFSGVERNAIINAEERQNLQQIERVLGGDGNGLITGAEATAFAQARDVARAAGRTLADIAASGQTFDTARGEFVTPSASPANAIPEDLRGLV